MVKDTQLSEHGGHDTLVAPGDLKKGVEIRVIGEPSADIKDKRVKAERLFLGKQEYKLYPERD